MTGAWGGAFRGRPRGVPRVSFTPPALAGPALLAPVSCFGVCLALPRAQCHHAVHCRNMPDNDPSSGHLFIHFAPTPTPLVFSRKWHVLHRSTSRSILTSSPTTSKVLRPHKVATTNKVLLKATTNNNSQFTFNSLHHNKEAEEDAVPVSVGAVLRSFAAAVLKTAC